MMHASVPTTPGMYPRLRSSNNSEVSWYISTFFYLASVWPKMLLKERIWGKVFNHREDQSPLTDSHGNQLGFNSWIVCEITDRNMPENGARAAVIVSCFIFWKWLTGLITKPNYYDCHHWITQIIRAHTSWVKGQCFRNLKALTPVNKLVLGLKSDGNWAHQRILLFVGVK